MKEDIFAVITGDIVDSTTINADYHTILQAIVQDIKTYQDPDFTFEIFRGDSFQGLIKNPTQALLLSILIRTGLRRNSRGKSLEDIWDARISIGIGPINEEKLLSNIKLGELEGEAFVRSGRTLETMKKEGSLLKISTGDKQLDSEFAAICPLIDAIISRWTIAQAEAVYLYLLRDITQKQIGEVLGVVQKSISKRLESSSLDSMNEFFKRYKEVIQWKFSN